MRPNVNFRRHRLDAVHNNCFEPNSQGYHYQTFSASYRRINQNRSTGRLAYPAHNRSENPVPGLSFDHYTDLVRCDCCNNTNSDVVTCERTTCVHTIILFLRSRPERRRAFIAPHNDVPYVLYIIIMCYAVKTMRRK